MAHLLRYVKAASLMCGGGRNTGWDGPGGLGVGFGGRGRGW